MRWSRGWPPVVWRIASCSLCVRGCRLRWGMTTSVAVSMFPWRPEGSRQEGIAICRAPVDEGTVLA